MRKKIEHELSGTIGSKAKSSTGSALFFPENLISEQYRDLFSITSPEFDKAFRIVTGGVGSELSKINSLTSSSLLSLLVFHPLFENSSGASISLSLPTTDTKQTFDQCFFEVRNKVIRRPSCIDVVLQSNDKKTLLFLESKFLEYEKTTTKATYGKSYLSLYSEYLSALLNPLEVKTDKAGKTILISKESAYIEGIKQSVSHIIGLVRGPKREYSDCYTREYFEAYSEAYNRAETLIYGTILFNPIQFEQDSPCFRNYVDLYTNIVGKHGVDIVGKVRDWCNDTRMNDYGKTIVVLERPLTYSADIPSEYIDLLSSKVRKFYRL